MDISETQAAINFVKRVWESKVCGPKKSKIVFFSESNYGGPGAANEIYKAIRMWARQAGCEILALCEDKGKNHNRPGFWLTHQTKVQMLHWTRSLINANELVFHDPVVSSLAEPMAMFYEQAAGYMKKMKRGGRAVDDGAFDPIIPFVYSGKPKPDDLIVIAQETLFLLHRVDEQDGALVYQDLSGLDVDFARHGLVLTANGTGLAPRVWNERTGEFVNYNITDVSEHEQKKKQQQDYYFVRGR